MIFLCIYTQYIHMYNCGPVFFISNPNLHTSHWHKSEIFIHFIPMYITVQLKYTFMLLPQFAVYSLKFQSGKKFWTLNALSALKTEIPAWQTCTPWPAVSPSTGSRQRCQTWCPAGRGWSRSPCWHHYMLQSSGTMGRWRFVVAGIDVLSYLIPLQSIILNLPHQFVLTYQYNDRPKPWSPQPRWLHVWTWRPGWSCRGSARCTPPHHCCRTWET